MIQDFQINSKEIDKIKEINTAEKKFRIKNLELFKHSGFPNKKLEDWKFSDFKNIIDNNLDWTFSIEDIQSKSSNTPLVGMKLKGKVIYTFNNSKYCIIYN